jgi:two-component system, cell cycle response regulator DivK
MERTETILEKSNLKSDYSWKDRTILIAEDIELNYLYLKEILKSTGVSIFRVENGLLALEYCQRKAPVDLIVMDLLMPVMNGYEATRQIKKQFPNIPIIAQTAYAMTEDRKKAMEAGCNDYVTKPIEKEILLSKINHYLLV